MKIVIAGASGYVGQALVAGLLRQFPEIEIVCLSRSKQDSEDARVTWQACDLFSLKDLERCVPRDVSFAYYLVHSMGPTAKLDQGSFADYDLLLADNFLRCLQGSSVKRLIYVGGLIPERHHLSLHLQSRLEVEETFVASNFPVTIYRAGLIVGEQGSSFQILAKLVRRLPVMICPGWTQTLMTPVALDTVVEALLAPLSHPQANREVLDLAGCEPITYVDMMRETARVMGKKRFFLTVPFFTPTLSRLWVRLITGSSKELIYPLVESLRHEMVARPGQIFSPPPPGKPYSSLLNGIPLCGVQAKKAHVHKPFRAKRKTVRSVQRLLPPPGRNAAWVTDQYIRWLPRFFRPWIRVVSDGNFVRFCFLAPSIVLLSLRREPERSSPHRQLLYVEGGLLSAEGGRGRMEFREVLGGRIVLGAIHDFKPSLPWLMYRFTQALAHLWVMRSFARYLRRSREGAIPSKDALAS